MRELQHLLSGMGVTLHVREEGEEGNVEPFHLEWTRPENRDQNELLHALRRNVVKALQSFRKSHVSPASELWAPSAEETGDPTVPARFKCGLCRQLMSDPQITRCKHSTCSKCMKDWEMKKGPDGGLPNHRTCPVCLVYCRRESGGGRGCGGGPPMYKANDVLRGEISSFEKDRSSSSTEQQELPLPTTELAVAPRALAEFAIREEAQAILDRHDSHKPPAVRSAPEIRQRAQDLWTGGFQAGIDDICVENFRRIVRRAGLLSESEEACESLREELAKYINGIMSRALPASQLQLAADAEQLEQGGVVRADHIVEAAGHGRLVGLGGPSGTRFDFLDTIKQMTPPSILVDPEAMSVINDLLSVAFAGVVNRADEIVAASASSQTPQGLEKGYRIMRPQLDDAKHPLVGAHLHQHTLDGGRVAIVVEPKHIDKVDFGACDERHLKPVITCSEVMQAIKERWPEELSSTARCEASKEVNRIEQEWSAVEASGAKSKHRHLQPITVASLSRVFSKTLLSLEAATALAASIECLCGEMLQLAAKAATTEERFRQAVYVMNARHVQAVISSNQKLRRLFGGDRELVVRCGGACQKPSTELKNKVERLRKVVIDSDEGNAPPALSRQLLQDIAWSGVGSFGIDPRTGLHVSPTMAHDADPEDELTVLQPVKLLDALAKDDPRARRSKANEARKGVWRRPLLEGGFRVLSEEDRQEEGSEAWAQEPLDAVFLRKVDELHLEEAATDFCIHPPTFSAIVSEGMPLRRAKAPEPLGRFAQTSPESKAYVFTAEAMEALQCLAERHLEDLVVFARDVVMAKAKTGNASQILRKADIDLARCTGGQPVDCETRA